jgi:hypothetical protein
MVGLLDKGMDVMDFIDITSSQRPPSTIVA